VGKGIGAFLATSMRGLGGLVSIPNSFTLFLDFFVVVPSLQIWRDIRKLGLKKGF